MKIAYPKSPSRCSWCNLDPDAPPTWFEAKFRLDQIVPYGTRPVHERIAAWFYDLGSQYGIWRTGWWWHRRSHVK